MVLETLVKIEKGGGSIEAACQWSLLRDETGLEDSFFVNIIGRGYPSPTSHFAGALSA